MVDKKTLKIGVAVLAGVALVIGLSVGLTQNKNTASNAMSASNGMGVTSYDFESDCEGVLVSYSGSGKSGKSGSGSGSAKSGKSVRGRRLQSEPSGKSSKSGSGKSGKSGSGSAKSGKGGAPALVSVSFASFGLIPYDAMSQLDLTTLAHAYRTCALNHAATARHASPIIVRHCAVLRKHLRGVELRCPGGIRQVWQEPSSHGQEWVR
jgi:hypothetical protein